ncbi:MAG: AMP-binding protein [Candidatus Lambdaproteobacteria bacterium]|nr:AMP-binding protein [Candidatus Lambdaproteobacteria bacterium]
MVANEVPLTPLSFLQRTARVYPGRTAVVYGERRWSVREFHGRVCRLANALRGLGVGRETKVALLSPNIPLGLEAHFGIPWAGGTVVAMNVRLNPREIAYIVNHSQSEVLVADGALAAALEPVWGELGGLRHVVVAEDDLAGPRQGWRPPRALAYEELLAGADAGEPPPAVADERQVIAINYTSGTTGDPKGVMYTHRGAYLNVASLVMENGLGPRSVYLWVVPMFHCNGWCYTWAVPGIGAANVCLRAIDAARIRELVLREQVDLFCGAPVVLQMLASLPDAARFRFERTVRACTGGAPPSPTLLAAMRRMNVDVTHLYGLTETYGPSTICEVQEDWLRLPLEGYAEKLARQGVAHYTAGEVTVLDRDDRRVPADAKTLGEVAMRGNTVMAGYFRDPEATGQAFRGGWFHSGDLGVLHADGYIELRDRAKDIIISGGENVSTIEVENALLAHPQVEEAAVVSRPDERWGEVPVAFVWPRAGEAPSEAELIAHCRERLAHFKCPKAVLFERLPRTSTGKVQKFALRERLWQGQVTRIKGN